MNFDPKLVLDSRIADISDRVDVAVHSGAGQVSYTPYASTNVSNSSLTFNVNIPSENLAIDRRVLLSTRLGFTVRVSDVPVGENAFHWGSTDGYGEFPLNSLFSQVTAKINNVSFTVPLDDVRSMLLRGIKQDSCSKLNGSTASYLDHNYSKVSDAMGSSSNPLSGMANVQYNNDVVPRGTLPSVEVVIQHYNAGNALVDDSPIATAVGDYFICQIQAPIVEPIMYFGPFQGLHPVSNDGALLGINNMNLVCNINQDLSGLYKTGNDYTYAVTLGVNGGVAFSDSKLLICQMSLTPQQYQRVSTRNVTSIVDYPRYISQGAALAAGARTKFVFPQMQLSQIPDKLLIAVLPPTTQAEQLKYQANFLTINQLQITFNNTPNLMSEMSQVELFNTSQKNGSHQTFAEFSGVSRQTDPANPAQSTAVSTMGSCMVVDPAYDFSLPSYLSNGSIGQFGVQITVDVTNNHDYDFDSTQMVVIAQNSGLFITEQGSSTLYSGLLTKDMVLKVKSDQPEVDSSTFRQLTGGAMEEASGTKLGSVLAKHRGRPMVLKAAGMSAGGMSAGGMSAGRMDRYK